MSLTNRSLRAVSVPETAVRSMRVLMTGYQLWGRNSRVEVGELAALVRTPAAQLRPVLAELVREGLVSLDRQMDAVALTEDGLRALDVERTTPLM